MLMNLKGMTKKRTFREDSLFCLSVSHARGFVCVCGWGVGGGTLLVATLVTQAESANTHSF
jgi:hypothetical protein